MILEQLLSYEATLAKKCKKNVSVQVKQRLLTKKGFLKSLFKVNDKQIISMKYATQES